MSIFKKSLAECIYLDLSYLGKCWDLCLLLLEPFKVVFDEEFIPILSSNSLRLTKWSGLGGMIWWEFSKLFKPSVISLMAIDIVSIDPSVLDQFWDGFLHLKFKMWHYCVLEESDRFFQTHPCTIMIQNKWKGFSELAQASFEKSFWTVTKAEYLSEMPELPRYLWIL